MTDNSTPLLDAAALRRLAESHATVACGRCAALRAPGWEALPGGFERATLRQVGTLRQPGVEDPTLEEYHPHGTRGWSPTTTTTATCCSSSSYVGRAARW